MTWYGRGPGECYSDKKLSQRAGVYSVVEVAQLWTDYEFPQESGNRTDTRWVRLAHAGGETITAQFVDLVASPSSSSSADGEKRKLFDFNASHYRVADVEAASTPTSCIGRGRRTWCCAWMRGTMVSGAGPAGRGPETRAAMFLQIPTRESLLLYVLGFEYWPRTLATKAHDLLGARSTLRACSLEISREATLAELV
ncbi:Uu.00g144470.m01.CDS01 [Anthostomella pinea]|uniref:beta-galactosidase n=1 Tax=Anthostomella pinea TaxID=933095 RepID=A0AAI8YJD1_9PEZI|nr:Uu.00g144470.m01.CDS01 [Anthostomella pinea]